MIEYLSYECDHELTTDEVEQFEEEYGRCHLLCHRDLKRICSSDLIKLIEIKQGFWADVTTIKFYCDYGQLVNCGYEGLDDNRPADFFPVENA
jgi:hypothetical protein